MNNRDHVHIALQYWQMNTTIRWCSLFVFSFHFILQQRERNVWLFCLCSLTHTNTRTLLLFFLHFYLCCLCVKHTAKVEDIERVMGNTGVVTRIYGDVVILWPWSQVQNINTQEPDKERMKQKNHFRCKIKHLFRISSHRFLSGILPYARPLPPSPRHHCRHFNCSFFDITKSGIRCWWTIG